MSAPPLMILQVIIACIIPRLYQDRVYVCVCVCDCVSEKGVQSAGQGGEGGEGRWQISQEQEGGFQEITVRAALKRWE